MIKDLLEKLELVCPSDPEMQLGDTYFAETEKDVFDGLDKLIPGDALGIYLKHKEIDETQELTIEMLDEDKYKMYIEKDTEENSNDWEGKNVLDTNPIDKNQVIETLNSLLQDYKVIANKNESIKESKKDFYKDYFYSFGRSYTLDRWFLIDCMNEYKPKKYKSIEVIKYGINGVMLKTKGEIEDKEKGNFFYLHNLEGKTDNIDSSEIVATIYHDKVWIPDNMINDNIGGALKTFCKNWSNTGRHANRQTEYNIELFDLSLEDNCPTDKAIKQFIIKFEELLQKIDDRVTWEKDFNKNESVDDIWCAIYQGDKIIANKNESVLPDRLVEAKIDHLIDRDGDWYLMQINTKPVLFCLRNSFDGNKVEILQNKKSEWIITFNDKQEASFKRNNLDGIIDFINNNYPIELPLDVLEELVDLQEEELNESLAGYKTVAKIIQNKNGFNIAEEDEPMLNEDQPTLKTLLTKLAKYL